MALQTKREVIGQMTVCSGCYCGAVHRGKPEVPVDPNIRDVQERLQRALGLKVNIDDHNGRGKVIIEYARLEDFDSLLERLAGA